MNKAGSPAVQPAIAVLGKLAMADIFILALFVVIAKGIGIGTIEVAWGLYLFTLAVIASFAVSLLSRPGRGATGRRLHNE